jgi:N-methylhydantoinase B
VDIGFMGLKGGSGAMHGTDGYDHIGMIDASGGVLDQDYEMFEQMTPHRLVRHEYQPDSAGPGQWRGGLGVITEFVIGSDQTQLVIFGDGDFEPAFGPVRRRRRHSQHNSPDFSRWQQVVPRNKDLIKRCRLARSISRWQVAVVVTVTRPGAIAICCRRSSQRYHQRDSGTAGLRT